MVLHLPTHHREVDQDDSSISSTLTVERLDETKALQSSVVEEHNTNKLKKNVCFDMTKNVSYRVDHVEPYEGAELWYGAQDYRDFKSIAQDASNQIIQIEARNRAPYSYQRVLEHAFNACLLTAKDVDEVLPQSEFVHLQRWLEVATSRCGLEKWSIRKVSRDKSCRRRELNKTVQNMQFSARSSTGSNNADQNAESLRISCENISRPSRLYSRTLAMALAAAVQSEQLKEMQ